MTTIEHKNIPSRLGGGGGQVLIQVQLIYSLSFVTMTGGRLHSLLPDAPVPVCFEQVS